MTGTIENADSERTKLDCAINFESSPKRSFAGQLSQLLGKFGVSRVADITGLDVLGVPVFSAVQPAARGLCISNGKGLMAEHAWVSAVMEAAEQFYSEDATRLITHVDSITGMARQGLRTVALDRQSRADAIALDDGDVLAWVEGRILNTNERVYAPFELVGMDLAAESPWNRDAFAMSSLGLGAGASETDAIVHGLQELIEEDAVFGPILASRNSLRDRHDPVEFSNSNGDQLKSLIADLASRGFKVGFRNATEQNELPVVMALVYPDGAETASKNAFDGTACRRTLEHAATAALLEAIQCRLTYISGSRDDLLPDEYGLPPPNLNCYGEVQFVDKSDDIKSSTKVKLWLSEMSDILAKQGIENIYVFNLGGIKGVFEVVRVLADDLLTIAPPRRKSQSRRAGRKILQALAAT